jgi:hypothetical protein
VNPDQTYEFIVHTFSLGDVEDPEIYAAGPLFEWQQTEKGKWVMDNAIDKPTFNIHTDQWHIGYQVAVKAEFNEKNATFYSLKYK